MAFTALTRPWSLLQFRNNFFTQTVGLLGRVIRPSQGRYEYTGQHKQRINAYADIHGFSGIRTHDPSVRASEDRATCNAEEISLLNSRRMNQIGMSTLSGKDIPVTGRGGP
jgi:hypothetical protein